MIIDKIENQKIYRNLNDRFCKAFDYLKNNNLTQIPTGKYEIAGDEIFAIVMDYETRDKSECKYEGHHQYIDLQYIITGSELVGVSILTNQTPFEKSPENDYDLYNIESDLIEFEAGMFMIFFPDDLHMPGVSLNQVQKVRKVVVKIKYED